MTSSVSGRLAARQPRSGSMTIFSMAKSALAFVSIAPFGGPVVPDV